MRLTRVNALLLREISDILHTGYKDEAVGITPIEVSITPNLREAHVYYSVLEPATTVPGAEAFFTSRGRAIRQELGRRVTLKYLPNLRFHYDSSIERGTRVIQILDELEGTEEAHDEHG